jgi:hypothetical protein
MKFSKDTLLLVIITCALYLLFFYQPEGHGYESGSDCYQRIAQALAKRDGDKSQGFDVDRYHHEIIARCDR